MKREIIFRALKDDMSNCTFKYGQLVYDAISRPRITEVDISGEGLTFHTCINGTESQFTGAKDKNGNKIFEGDFDEDYQVVMWCENSYGWQWATYDFPTKDKICCHCYNCEGDYNFNEQIERVEIKGNIYENAEVQTS